MVSRHFLFLSLAVLSFGSLAKAERESWITDFMINMTGTYRVAEDVELKIYLEEPREGIIDYRITHGETETEPNEAWSILNAPWFIFVEDADRYWSYDGQESLVLIEFNRSEDGNVEAVQTPVDYEDPEKRKTLPGPVAKKVGARM